MRLLSAAEIAEPVGTAPQQRGCGSVVAALNVGEADGELGEATPQIPLLSGAGFPHRFEHFVGREGPARVDELLGEFERLLGGLGDLLSPFFRVLLSAVFRVLLSAVFGVPCAPRQGTPGGVSRPGASRPAPFVPVPVASGSRCSRRRHGHQLPSASHRRISAVTASGSSSCGKWPRPSNSRHSYFPRT